jgi:hypothetical protein
MPSIIVVPFSELVLCITKASAVPSSAMSQKDTDLSESAHSQQYFAIILAVNTLN